MVVSIRSEKGPIQYSFRFLNNATRVSDLNILEGYFVYFYAIFPILFINLCHSSESMLSQFIFVQSVYSSESMLSESYVLCPHRTP
jgi:hypothetical protein